MRVMISCAEASGDLYAGDLAREILAREPTAKISGFGGARLRAAGARLVGDFHGLSVTGLSEALRVVPRSWTMLRRIVAQAKARRPDVFVAIDAPDFNFRLLRAMRKLGIPVVYYISPQLWAWRPGRMKTMQKLVDRVLVIFPFEEQLYKRAGVDVQFVGHPLVDLAKATVPRETFLAMHGLEPFAPTVALLPGSRRNELARILPDLAAAVPLIRQRMPGVQFLVACAPGLDERLFSGFGAGTPGAPVLVRDATDDVIAASDVVVTASGTATLQTALHGRPMVVVYRLSRLTYLTKPFALVDMYAMPNLIAGRRIVPELIQGGFTPTRVAEETLQFLTLPQRYATARGALADVRAQLGEPGASGRAAAAVIDVARRAMATTV
jgi:lipid-A-disaccharide synthase